MIVGVNGWDDFTKFLATLREYLRNPVKTFGTIKLIMFQDVMEHFDQQEGPDGPWQPLKIVGLEGGKLVSFRLKHGKAGHAMILQDTGHLKASIAMASGDKGAEVGTNLIYARTHQYGDDSRHIPQRTFLFLSEGAQQRIMDAFITDMRGLA